MSNNTATCLFKMDRDTYTRYKSVVSKHGQSVKGNLVSYMNYVINNATPNLEFASLFIFSEILIDK